MSEQYTEEPGTQVYTDEPTVVRDCDFEGCDDAAFMTAVDNRPDVVQANDGEGVTYDACLNHVADVIWRRGLQGVRINEHVPVD